MPCNRTLLDPNQTDQTIHPESLPVATVNGVDVSIEKFNRLYEARVSKYRTEAPNILPMVALGIKAAIVTRLIDERLSSRKAKPAASRFPTTRFNPP